MLKPLMLKRMVLLGAFFAFGGLAIAATDPANVKGEPPAIETGKAPAFYFWTTPKSVHLRWTSGEKPTLFTGTLETGQLAGEIKRVNQMAGGWIDKKDEKILMFSATATTSLDGADIEFPAGTTINLFVEIDGVTADPAAVHVGQKMEHPKALPFKFKTQ